VVSGGSKDFAITESAVGFKPGQDWGRLDGLHSEVAFCKTPRVVTPMLFNKLLDRIEEGEKPSIRERKQRSGSGTLLPRPVLGPALLFFAIHRSYRTPNEQELSGRHTAAQRAAVPVRWSVWLGGFTFRSPGRTG
jgi:hypothetical protein